MIGTEIILFVRRTAARLERIAAFTAARAGVARTTRSETFADGLPPGLDESVLSEVAGRLDLGPVRNLRHRHTSGWKNTGAFRIVFDAEKAGPRSMIYKNSVYSNEEVPALQGLGFSPGPGEYVVYRHASHDARRFIPVAYWTEEIEPQRHYRYLMEDLRPGYRPLVWDRDRIAVCEGLPAFHETLRRCGDAQFDTALPRYDRSFATNLLDYAFTNIEAYQRERPQPTVRQLLDRWDAVTGTYRQALESALSSCDPTVVHGDCNVANVVFSRKNGHPRLYDFEWAGVGLPHQDLASILKGSSPRTERRGVGAYSRQSGQRSEAADWKLYLFCSLQRAVLDASFVARQSISQPGQAVKWFRRFIVGAAHAALRNERRLRNL
ncbi:MAG: aminoglycoside phosphotransferase family protein [Alphaproteobacteria bacterium]|nr:aminoglycoside phosphotransferase family protein [Alphaproteobacteria bacterium]